MAPARLLSDRGTSFTSSIIWGTVQDPWHQTTADHALPSPDKWAGREITPDHYVYDQEAGRDKKSGQPSHLAEKVHAYNATWSAVTGYSPHYLMFGWQPRLPVDFFFPSIGSNEAPTREASTKCVDVYLASVRIDWGLPCGRHRPNQPQKHANRNGTMTEK